MKLEKKEIEVSNIRYKILMVIIFIGFEILAIEKFIDAFNGKNFMLFFAVVYGVFPFLIHFIFKKLNKKSVEDVKNIKEIGKKVKGKIVDIKKVKRYRSYSYMQCLIVVFEDRSTTIYDMIENDAFSILKMLLDEYPLKTVNTVPVDVYMYKNKVYVDLESVELSKVDGYEEAVKLLEDMKDDVTMR